MTFISLILIAGNVLNNEGSVFNYFDNGTSWPEEYPKCKSLYQSPVNIIPTKVKFQDCSIKKVNISFEENRLMTHKGTNE